MPVERTPPPSTNADTDPVFVPPSGKLAAVSRKGNELTELMNNNVTDLDLLNKQYESYLEKIRVLEEACTSQTNLNEDEVKNGEAWLAERKPAIVTLRISFEQYSNRLRGAIPKTARSRHSHVSSACSRTSSARVKLAELKAKLAADKVYNEKLNELKLQEVQREIELRKLEEEKQKIEHDVLEAELTKLDEIANELENASVVTPPEPTFAMQTPVKLPPPLQASTAFQNPPVNPPVTKIVEVIEKQNEISLKIAKHQEKAELPKRELSVFNGEDIVEYRAFIQNFKRTITKKCESPADCFYYLEQYTSGFARQLVRSCSHNDEAIAYEQAIQLLEDEYGNEHRAAAAYLQKLENWPVIKSEDGEALRKLSVYLLTCVNCMSGMTAMNQLNSPKEIMNVVMKLPFELRKRWRSKTMELTDNGSTVIFSDLVEFVRKQSRLANQPLYGNIKDVSNQTTARTISRTIQGGARVLSTMLDDRAENESTITTTNSGDNACLYCRKTNHNVTYCYFFKRLPSRDRTKFFEDHKLCFGCAKPGHRFKGCAQKLTCQTCKRRHPTILHDDEFIQRNPTEIQRNSTSNEIPDSDNDPGVCLSASIGSTPGAGKLARKIVCSVLPIEIAVSGRSESLKTYAALDTCSDGCFIDSQLLPSLGVPNSDRSMNIRVIGNENSEVSTTVLNNVKLYDLDRNNYEIVPVVFALKSWPFNETDQPREEDFNLPHLADVPFRFIKSKVGMIIGMNRSELIKPLQIVNGPPNTAYASLHKLGWALNGPVDRKTEDLTSVRRTAIEKAQDLEAKIDDMFNNDYKDGHIAAKEYSEEDLKWKEIMDKSTKLDEENHYEIDLPLKFTKLPHNREQIYNMFLSLLRKLEKNQSHFTEYKDFMNMMLVNGYAEKVPIEELKNEAWYLPHHSVYHPVKEKIRIVFNCSKRCNGISLNDCLYTGPNMANNLLGVLLRFRQRCVAFMGDITKMFYQVKVPPKQRNYLRFFWIDDSAKHKIAEYRLTVHLFGATSSPSVASYALRRTASDNLHFSKETRSAVQRNFYVDDLLCSVETDEEAVKLLPEIRSLLKTGGFELSKFATNSKVLYDEIITMNLEASMINIPSNKLLNISDDKINSKSMSYNETNNFALGLRWNIERDVLTYNIRESHQPVTRRGILSVIHGVYDPLGLLSPITIPAKVIFQDTCRLQLSWDEPLPHELQQRWAQWRGELPLLLNYEVKRSNKPFAARRSEIHFFCDGSETAYGSVVYSRFLLENGDIYCSPIIAKARLTPINTYRTIPRIELNAAKLAVLLKQILDAELDYEVNEWFFWTDSTTVLHYIQ